MKTAKAGKEFNETLEQAVLGVDTDFAAELLRHHPDYTDPMDVIDAVEACIAQRPAEESYLWYAAMQAYIKEVLEANDEYFRAAPLHQAYARASEHILEHRNRAWARTNDSKM